MDALIKFFSRADLGLCVVAGLILFICAVPFVDLISGFWHSHFKKGG